MLIDELQEQLKSIEPDITTITSYWKNSGLEQRFTTLDTQSQQETFWQNPDQTAILKELDQYLLIVNHMRKLIAENDAAGLEKLFNKASRARQDLDTL